MHSKAMASIKLDRVNFIIHREPNLTSSTRVVSGDRPARHCAPSSGTELKPFQSKFLLCNLFVFLFFFSCLPSIFTGLSLGNSSSLFRKMILSLQPFGSKVSSSSYS